jgi:cobalt-zinc-cadmium resistance protein CzcA
MNAVIAFALRQRVLMLLLLLFMLGVGVANFLKLNIEAYPDPVPPLVDVVTQNPGQSAEEIERYITIPIEIQMAGIPNVTAVRTISLFGLSDVKVQFTYAFTYDEAQQWVINRLGNYRRCQMERPPRSRRTARPARSTAIGSSVRPASA